MLLLSEFSRHCDQKKQITTKGEQSFEKNSNYHIVIQILRAAISQVSTIPKLFEYATLKFKFKFSTDLLSRNVHVNVPAPKVVSS
jgi:uracil phosphoribosyltransferase